MKKFPFVSRDEMLIYLRVAVGFILAAHGIIRVYAGTVDNFGMFLSDAGFPFGGVVAWALSIFEIAGGITLAVGYFKRIICGIFIFELIAGIILVHAKNGWFVVGYTSGGMEYSVLLILCLLLIAADEK